MVDEPSKEASLRFENLDMQVAESSKIFEEDRSPDSPVIAVKDKTNYLVGSTINFNLQRRSAFRLFRWGSELYSHKSSSEEALKGAVYVRSLDCYFLVYEFSIYRKDINDKPPLLFMNQMLNQAVENVRSHPSLPGRLILVSKGELRILNLKLKKFELIFKKNGFEVVSRAISFWGSRNSSALATLQPKNFLSMVGLASRRETHKKQIVQVRDFWGASITANTISTSPDNKFIFLSHDYTKFASRKFYLKVYEVSRTSFKLRAEYEADEIKVHKILFLRRFGQKYVFVVVQEFVRILEFANHFFAELFVFDASQGSIEKIKGARIDLENPPLFAEMAGPENFFFVDKELFVTKVSLFNKVRSKVLFLSFGSGRRAV